MTEQWWDGFRELARDLSEAFGPEVRPMETLFEDIPATRLLWFTVPGKPRAWQRAQTRTGRYFTDKKTLEYERRLAAEAYDVVCNNPQIQKQLPIGGAVGVSFVAFFTRPKTAPSRPFPHVRPDLDNVAKIVLDGLSKARIWKDDAQVCQLLCEKKYDEHPRLEVEVYRL